MNRININGRVFSGGNIVINNGRVIIDGKDATDAVGKPENGILEVRVLEGIIEKLECDASVTCGEVRGSVEAGGSVTADAVGGNVSAGGSVNCDDVHGNASAGGSINCGSIGGNVMAGGSVRRG